MNLRNVFSSIYKLPWFFTTALGTYKDYSAVNGSVPAKLSSMMLVYVLGFISVLCLIIYLKLKNIYTYWTRRGVKGPKPLLLVGNFKTIIQKKDSMRSLMSKYYQEYPNEKVVGIYQGVTPTLIIRDPKTIKQVLIKDFSCFRNRGINVTNEILLRNLFFQHDDTWKALRLKLSPIFTSGKLKQMMPLFKNCVECYVKYIEKLVDVKQLCEIREINVKYALKCITSCAFGFEADTFSDESNFFSKISDKIFEPDMKKTGLLMMLESLMPGLSAQLNLKILKPEITDFFCELASKIIREREGRPKLRKDFMDLLVEMKERGKIYDDDIKITDALIVAQIAVFYAAGFETSSGAMSFMLYELALNPIIQERCYEEIQRVMVKYNGELNLDALTEFKYIPTVFEEVLRKYPVANILFRESSCRYTFPESNLVIDKGIKIMILLDDLQNDPKYFEDPEKFDPGRFSPENRKKIAECTYLPFGDGPRSCIGTRFAQVQSLLGIVHFLYYFQVQPSESTVKKIRYDPEKLTLSSLDGIWLHVSRRKKC